jgi:hypothetical protein
MSWVMQFRGEIQSGNLQMGSKKKNQGSLEQDSKTSKIKEATVPK